MSGLLARETSRFLERVLPAGPLRLLAVTAGEDETMRALAARGDDVTSLDEEDFLYAEAHRAFDAAVFLHCLHRMQPVGRTLDRARELLVPGGLVVAEQVAYDRVNVHTARWLYDLESVLVASEAITPPDPGHASERRPLARWRLEHAADPPLSSGHDLLAAARERFELIAVEESPFLYRYLAERSRPGDLRAGRVVESVFELESRLVRERDIAAAGLRFAGRRAG